jgi:hypothetical protein
LSRGSGKPFQIRPGIPIILCKGFSDENDEQHAKAIGVKGFLMKPVATGDPAEMVRQSFLDGSLTRLLDPDSVLKTKIVEWVSKGEFGLASGLRPDGTYERLWFEELVGTDEILFDSGVFLLNKKKAKILKSRPGIDKIKIE